LEGLPLAVRVAYQTDPHFYDQVNRVIRSKNTTENKLSSIAEENDRKQPNSETSFVAIEFDDQSFNNDYEDSYIDKPTLE
jgi:hypothetical protein